MNDENKSKRKNKLLCNLKEFFLGVSTSVFCLTILSLIGNIYPEIEIDLKKTMLITLSFTLIVGLSVDLIRKGE